MREGREAEFEACSKVLFEENDCRDTKFATFTARARQVNGIETNRGARRYSLSSAISGKRTFE